MAIDATLRAMLEARSVAVVGASQRPGTPGNQMVRQLLVGRFAGEVAAVNPRYDEVEGVACYPSLKEVPFAPDLVLLGVSNRLLEEQMVAAAGRGARGVVVFASGLEDPPGEIPLTERLRRIAREAGMVVCGGNCMGFADIERGLRALAFEERADLEPGGWPGSLTPARPSRRCCTRRGGYASTWRFRRARSSRPRWPTTCSARWSASLPGR